MKGIIKQEMTFNQLDFRLVIVLKLGIRGVWHVVSGHILIHFKCILFKWKESLNKKWHLINWNFVL